MGQQSSTSPTHAGFKEHSVGPSNSNGLATGAGFVALLGLAVPVEVVGLTVGVDTVAGAVVTTGEMLGEALKCRVGVGVFDGGGELAGGGVVGDPPHTGSILKQSGSAQSVTRFPLYPS